MQLVDEGRVELDAPANRYLDPPLRLADQHVADTVTVRQLLSHTGGFFGDAEDVPGENDDAVQHTVATYDTLPQLHAPGRLFSYSNAGFNVLGRVVECVTGQTWDDALTSRLLRPLGLDDTFSRLTNAATHPLAVGHEPRSAEDLALEPVSAWYDTRGSGPCGGTLATTAADLLGFAQLHMRDGAAPDGRQLLSPETARLMRQPQIVQPDPIDAPAWGLGWAVARPADPQVVEHGGNTCGQESILVVAPERGVAVCVLTNGDYAERLRKEISGQLLHELVGVQLPNIPPPGPADAAPDPEPIVGSYRRSPEVIFHVERGDAGLTITCETSGKTGERVATFSAPLLHATGPTYLFTMPLVGEPWPATFLYDDGAQRASHLTFGLRVAPRVDGG